MIPAEDWGKWQLVAMARDYADMGASGQIYSHGDFTELETLGPLTELDPGEATEHHEDWEIHLVDEADPLRACGTNRLSGQDDPQRVLHSDQGWQFDRSSEPGQDAEPHLREADGSRASVGRDTIVAVQNELGSASHAGAIDRRHGRNTQALDAPDILFGVEGVADVNQCEQSQKKQEGKLRR